MPADIGHRDLMLATPGKLFAGAGWIFELKYDGYRCLTRRNDQRTLMLSRNGKDMAGRFPELVEDVGAIEHPIIFDGELVILDEMGRPQWDRLRSRHAARHQMHITAGATSSPAAIFAFDLLWYRGRDYRPRPLIERKAALVAALKPLAQNQNRRRP